MSASGISISKERVFSYSDLLVSKRNRLTSDTIRKMFCLRTWLKFGKYYYTKEKMRIITAFEE